MKIRKEVEEFVIWLRQNSDSLNQRVIRYFEKADVLKDSDFLKKALNSTIAEISRCLMWVAKKTGLKNPEFFYLKEKNHDPAFQLGKLEAVNHRYGIYEIFSLFVSRSY